MNLKFFSTIILAIGLSFSAFSQTESREMKHNSMHEKLLAKQQHSGMDRKTIEQVIQHDVSAREDREPVLSKESADLVEAILQEAKSHLGKRYVWASKGPDTFDCSGFTGYVFKQFGIKIGSDSRGQYKYGTPVDRKNLRKGDLVFFTSRRSGQNVGHVGIVWEVNRETGDFKFIHASTKGGIRISEFEGYYVNRYIGAKRVIE